MPRRSEPPDGAAPRRARATTPPRTTRRSRHAEDVEAPAQGRAGLGGLLRGPGSVLGGLSGIDGAGRSLDRLSRAAERGADFLDRLDEEVGLDRAADLVDRLETLVSLLEGRGVLADRLRHLVHAVEGMHHSLQEIEAMVVDLHENLMPPPRERRKPAAARPRR
jgi:hypothetical protein